MAGFILLEAEAESCGKGEGNRVNRVIRFGVALACQMPADTRLKEEASAAVHLPLHAGVEPERPDGILLAVRESIGSYPVGAYVAFLSAEAAEAIFEHGSGGSVNRQTLSAPRGIDRQQRYPYI